MTCYFKSADDRMHSKECKYGVGLSDLIHLAKEVVPTVIEVGKAGKQIKDAVKSGKSDKDIIEEMKTENIYKDLLDLENLNKLKTGRGFKII